MEQYVVSARKYRPSTFASVVGQRALTSTLKNAIATGRLAHSYLFCGSRGVGKTSCARIFAKTINCQNPTADGEACNECDSCRDFNEGTSLNIIELDAASNNGVEDIRQLVEQVQMPPSQGRYRVFIVDEVHMLSSAAFNAFLKTLEEPPSYVIFILATTEKHKIIPTILSRCQIYDFARITVRDIIDHLAYVAQSEGIKAETAALNVIARKADGAMRDALSIFDQVAASSRGDITYRSAIENLNVLDSAYYSRLLDCFLTTDVLQSWLIYKEIRDKGFDSHFFITGLADFFRSLMVASSPATLTLLETDDEERAKMAEAAKKCSPAFIYRAMNLLNEADLNYRTASNKQFLVEITLAKICQSLSPSPKSDGAGEGRLQPITASVNPAVSQTQPQPQPAAAPTPAPTPAAPVSTAAPAVPKVSPKPAPAPAPTQPSAGAKSVKGGFSLRDAFRGNTPAAAAQQASAASPQRNAPFDADALRKVWMEFAAENPTEHILINTMRASVPEKVTDVKYKVTVENETQSSRLQAFMPKILQKAHDTLSNDLLTIDIELNQGESSPQTWNEREVLAHITETVPGMADFISRYRLTL